MSPFCRIEFIPFFLIFSSICYDQGCSRRQTICVHRLWGERLRSSVWKLFQNWMIDFIKRIEWIKRSFIFVSYISTSFYFFWLKSGKMYKNAKNVQKTYSRNQTRPCKAVYTLFECCCNFSIMSWQSFASFIKVFRKQFFH